MKSSFKTEHPRSIFTLLILLSVLVILTGCTKNVKQPAVPGEKWAEDLRSRVEEQINEPEKKRQLMGLVDQDADILKKMSQQTERYNKALFAVDRNYNSTPEDFRKVFSEFNATRNRLRADSLDIRFKMKVLCSPDEWKSLSHFRAKDSLFNQMFPKPRIE